MISNSIKIFIISTNEKMNKVKVLNKFEEKSH